MNEYVNIVKLLLSNYYNFLVIRSFIFHEMISDVLMSKLIFKQWRI